MNFSQGDIRWGSKEIAPGQTMRRIGCLVTSMAEASVRLGVIPPLTPGTLLARAKLIPGVFNTSGAAVVAKLAKAAGVVADPIDRRFSRDGHEVQRKTIFNGLTAGLPVLLHVDYSDDADERGNHFVCAIALHEGPGGTEIEYVDPAFGRTARLSHVLLQGQSLKPTRRYKVVSVIPVRAAGEV